MKIFIKEKPMSVNEAWKGRRFKTIAYKEYERKILFLLPPFKGKVPDRIGISMHFGFSNISSDIDNPVKMLVDILQKKYGFNDRDVFEMYLTKSKVSKGDEFINIEILPMT